MTALDLEAWGDLDDHARAELWVKLPARYKRAINQAVLQEVGAIDPLEHLGWEEWNQAVAPRFFDSAYAPVHRDFWEWTDTITADVAPDPFLAFWPRGLAKSTTAEMAVVKLGCRGLRKYFLYVCHTQDQADDHIGNIAAILESEHIAEHYPAMGSVLTGKTGNSKGWRRNRLRTASGFTVDALGLDVAARGAKLEEQRPDGGVFDDIDDLHASIKVVAKNMRTISQDLLPAFTPNAVLMLANNLIGQNTIATQIHDGRADMLGDGIHSGPFPAVKDLKFERVGKRYVVTQGEYAWPERFGKEAVERQLVRLGPISYTIECQQDSSERPGAIWRKDEIEKTRVTAAEVPELHTVVVGIDPNKTGRGDDAGVVVVGVGDIDGVRHAYVIADYSGMSKPSEWRDEAARAAVKHNAPVMVVESAGLGEHAELTVRDAPLFEQVNFPISVEEAEAKLGKKDRARPIWRLYVDGLVHHVGNLTYLENQLTSWVPDTDPMSPGGLDAVVHALTYLMIDEHGAPNMGTAAN